MSDFLDRVQTEPLREQRDAAVNVLDDILEAFHELGRGYTTPRQQEILRRTRLLVLSIPREQRGYVAQDED
jgi:hypothetical protein